LFFLEGKEIEILKPAKKQGKLILESNDFIFIEIEGKIEKIHKKNLIIKVKDKNYTYFLKFDKIPNFKQRMKKIKKYLK
jgi:hypothetical protein